MYITFYALSSDNWRPPDSRAFSRSSGRIEVTFPAQWVTDLTTPSSHHCPAVGSTNHGALLLSLHQNHHRCLVISSQSMFGWIVIWTVESHSLFLARTLLSVHDEDRIFVSLIWSSSIFSFTRGNNNQKFACTHKNLQRYSFLDKIITVDYHILHILFRSWFSVILLFHLNLFD